MKVIVLLFGIWALIKNFSYGVYEYKVNKNLCGCISVILFSLFCFISICIALYLA